MSKSRENVSSTYLRNVASSQTYPIFPILWKTFRDFEYFTIVKVRVDNEETEDLEINRGVRQGCILSPTLFKLYFETIFAEAIEGLDCGVKINGRNINNIRYADEAVLIASLEDIQRIVTRVNMCSENAGLRMNISKTKFMVISKNKVDNIGITVAGQIVERVRNM
ncbi:jg22922 [Pararge aegeria aegeria]|uniref:Jg22922 protein n=1 Tax=Pararge aegeria aegeria TaxID=348720 RepID=A0A8S4QWS8_9NEOP|nr:jg22922 [Pararge aegeria aegeria]